MLNGLGGDDIIMVDWHPQSQRCRNAAAGRTAPMVRTGKGLNSEVERKARCRCTHLKQVQQCTDLPLQITLLAQAEQGKIRPGFG